MQERHTIKIFLASSEELAEERIRFGDFIRQLDDTFEIRGYRIKLFKWEDLPSGDNGHPKQDEYNDKVRECDMFVGLFHTKAGKYTLEEYDTAKATQKSSGKPILYVFCRELSKGERENSSLKQFKQKLTNEIKYFWIKYNSSDSLQLHFVLQLLKMENSRWDDLKVKKGSVRLGEVEIARMDKLCFAADNNEYQRMSQRLEALIEEIEDARLLVREHPEKERYKEKLQKLLDESAQLKEKFDRQQQLLLNTAIRLTQLQSENISENRKQAEKAFERGDLQTTNFILKETEKNGDLLFEEYERQEALQVEHRKNVHHTIEDLLLQTTTILADETRSIGERIDEVKRLFMKADRRAAASAYDKEKYCDLLFDYAQFLDKYGLYNDSKEVYLRQIDLAEELYDKEHESTAKSYNNIGVVYHSLGEYEKALEYFSKALSIEEKVLDIKHPITAISYNNIGLVYYEQGSNEKALEYFSRALEIDETVLGIYDLNTANCYQCIGWAYGNQGEYDKALIHHLKALDINEKVLGIEHPNTILSYCNVGWVCCKIGDYDKALEYYSKGLVTSEKVLGPQHPVTATYYNNIGVVYYEQGDYCIALEYYLNALDIREKILGTEHPDTAISYNNIGGVYSKQGDFDKALDYYSKALNIYKKVFDTEHADTAACYNNIGTVYYKQNDLVKASEYYFKALEIREKVLGLEHSDTAESYCNIGAVYFEQTNYSKALDYLNKAYLIYEKAFGSKHPNTENVLVAIHNVKKAFEIRKKL